MLTYQSSGVDIEAGEKLVEFIAKRAPQIGGFSGRFPLGNHYLVAGTDGVGTKLKIAFSTKNHTTVGIDLVAMCVNDILTCGATPLFFLDYFATSKLNLNQAKQVIEGILTGCELAQCVLLGGETAEMPGMYASGEYDLAGFAVGSVLKEDYIDNSLIEAGDIIVGLPSSGLHSNGFSLVRKVLEIAGKDFSGHLGETLLTPTRIYTKEVQAALKASHIKGMAHITGGGLEGNICRLLSEGQQLILDKTAWEIPQIFQEIQAMGEIESCEMWKTFNMGIGFTFAIAREEVGKLSDALPEIKVIGRIEKA